MFNYQDPVIQSATIDANPDILLNSSLAGVSR